MTMLARGDNGETVQAIYPGLTQKVAIDSGSSNAIAAGVGARTTVVMVQADVDCFIDVGASPTASTSTMPLWAKTPIFIAIKAGDKVAGKSAGVTGTLYVTEGKNL